MLVLLLKCSSKRLINLKVSEYILLFSTGIMCIRNGNENLFGWVFVNCLIRVFSLICHLKLKLCTLSSK